MYLYLINNNPKEYRYLDYIRIIYNNLQPLKNSEVGVSRDLFCIASCIFIERFMTGSWDWT